MFSKLPLISAILLIAGCFSVDAGSFSRTGEENVVVSNYGWYLFHVIPVVCGNASHDRWFPFVLLRNDVTMDKVQRRFMDYANSRGKVPTNLVYNNKESVMLEIPGIDFPLPVPYILTFRNIQLSGVLK